MRKRKPRQESGYALLLVFLMAAVIAISLYTEIPRVAFESQRQKEQLLVSRGEQYKRAIYMFVKTNNRWPTKIEDLESFNNRRFLRKRFSDPMTGKDEWRFIHIRNGVLTDSVKQKATGAATGGSQSQLVGEMPTTVMDTGTGAQGANPAMRRRSSDGMQQPGMGAPDGQPVLDPNNPNNPQATPNPMYPNGQPIPNQQYPNQQNPNQQYPPGVPLPPGVTAPTLQNPQTGQAYPPGFIPPQGVPMPGQPGYPNTGQPVAYPGQPQQYPGQPVAYPGQVQQYPGQVQQYPGQVQQYPGQVQQYPGQVQQYPGQAQQYPVQQPYPGQVQQYPGMPVNSQTGGVSPTPYPTYPGANGNPPGLPQAGMNPQQNPNAATQMIQQILTSPRPGGMPQAAAGTAVGEGIAGIASTADIEGIMLIGDRTNYKEWEFIHDPTKVKMVPNPLNGTPGTPAAQMGSTPGTSMGTPASQLGNMPGAQTGCVPSDFNAGTCGGLPSNFGPSRGGPVTIPPVTNPIPIPR